MGSVAEQERPLLAADVESGASEGRPRSDVIAMAMGEEDPSDIGDRSAQRIKGVVEGSTISPPPQIDCEHARRGAGEIDHARIGAPGQDDGCVLWHDEWGNDTATSDAEAHGYEEHPQGTCTDAPLTPHQ